MFPEAFSTALDFDATVLSLTFSDGSVAGRTTMAITGLFITDRSQSIKTHELNSVGELETTLFLFFADQVPSGAQIYAKQMIDAGGIKYNLETVILEYGIYTLSMRLFGMH
jgi:hypothetical protein